MRAGQLRERVTIQSSTEAADGAGQINPTFTTAAVRNARVEAIDGTERFAGERFATVTYHFTFRADSATKAITPEYRLVWDSKTFEVKSAITRDNRVVSVVASLHL